MNILKSADIAPVAEKIEPEQEAAIAAKALEISDIAEISANRATTLDKELSVSITPEITTTIPQGIEISVAQSVRNPSCVIVHFNNTLARVFGTGKVWTDEKIYKAFGKKYHETIQAWDAMVNELAITELPE